MPDFKRDTILNGTDPLVVLKHDGLTYRNHSIEEFFTFSVRNITGQQKRTLVFPSNMHGWYRIVNVMTSYEMDAITATQSTSLRDPARNIQMLLKSYENGIHKQTDFLTILQGKYAYSAVFFNTKHQNDLYTDVNVLEATFVCIPIHVIDGGRVG